jgi:hypothetical protein
MHNCRRIESQFVDLLFDDIEAERKRSLLREIDLCANCASQYQSLSDTLFVFERTTEAAQPDENYWPRYNAALRNRLDTPVAATSEKNDSLAFFWHRLWAAKLRIPAPVAAALLVAFVVSSALALLRAPRAETNSAAPEPPASSVRIIEVPVVREKIITRTVYVEKKHAMPARESQAVMPAVAQTNETNDPALVHSKPEEETGFFTRANLKGFQPADEMKIRVIKRNTTDEK